MNKYILPTLLASCISSSAAIIANPTATAFQNWNGSINIAQTVNDSNLSGTITTDADLLSVTHGNDAGSANQWHTRNTAAGNVDFTFATATDIGSIWIWNHNQVDGTADETNRGVATFELYYSTGGAFIQVGGTNNLTESAGAPNAPVSVSAEGFDINQTGVTAVRMIILSNHGTGNITGLAEVKFSDNDVATITGVVPEPSSTALLGLGGLALILRRRK